MIIKIPLIHKPLGHALLQDLSSMLKKPILWSGFTAKIVRALSLESC